MGGASPLIRERLEVLNNFCIREVIFNFCKKWYFKPLSIVFETLCFIHSAHAFSIAKNFFIQDEQFYLKTCEIQVFSCIWNDSVSKIYSTILKNTRSSHFDVFWIIKFQISFQTQWKKLFNKFNQKLIWGIFYVQISNISHGEEFKISKN